MASPERSGSRPLLRLLVYVILLVGIPRITFELLEPPWSIEREEAGPDDVGGLVAYILSICALAATALVIVVVEVFLFVRRRRRRKAGRLPQGLGHNSAPAA